MIAIEFFIIAQIIFIITLFILSGDKYKEVINNCDGNFQLLFLAPVTMYLIDSLNVIERFTKIVSNIHLKIIKIYGSLNGIIYTKLFIAQILSVELLVLLFFSIFSILTNDIVMLYFGMILLVMSPIMLTRGLDKEICKKQEQIIIELPELINKIILLINAGETIQQAIIVSVLKKKGTSKNYLYKELLISVNQLQNNVSLKQVLEELSKRCATQEISVFTTTVLLNFRRGSSDLVLSLTRLSQDLWVKRLSTSRIIGERASSKLVFPMVLIFIVVLVIVAAPAIMLF